MHFQSSLLLWELQVIRDWLCVRVIAEISLNRLLLFLIWKSSHRSYSVGKDVLENFTGKHFCWSVFLIKSQGLQHRQVLSSEICKIFEEHLFLKTTVSPCKSLFAVHEKETVNYFLKKVLSKIFDMVLNMPLSYYDSICYYNTDDN